MTQARRPDLELVDALARLQLDAHRLGCSVRLVNPSAELIELLDFVGLDLGVEVSGKAEGSEQVGVEEAVVPRDPTF